MSAYGPAVANFGEVVRDIIENRLHLTQREFTKKAGISIETLSRMLKMETPKVNQTTYRALAAGMNMSVEELDATWRDESPSRSIGALPALDDDALVRLARAMNITPTEAAKRLGKPEPKSQRSDFPEGAIELGRGVPVLGAVSAGDWLERVELPRDEHTARVPATTKDPRAFALVVDGDSMTPEYKKGDEIVVVPTLPREFVDDEDAVIQLGGRGKGESTFKRVRQYAHGFLYLYALNKKYGEMELDEREIIRAWRVVRHVRNKDKRR